MPLDRHRRRLPTAASLPTATVPSEAPPTYVSATYVTTNRSRARPKEVLDVLTRIDASSDPALAKQFLEWVEQVYRERQGGQLVGLFAKCLLGPPYVDHRLALSGHIVEHFRPEDVPPPPFASARQLVRSTAYAYVEIYSDGAIVPIRPDGTQAV